MKIPDDAYIPLEKLTKYLLVFKEHDDKSLFLLQAGFDLSNVEILITALRQLALENDATSDRENEYGVYYRVAGELIGVTRNLSVITIWLHDIKTNQYRFVTLKPLR